LHSLQWVSGMIWILHAERKTPPTFFSSICGGGDSSGLFVQLECSSCADQAWRAGRLLLAVPFTHNRIGTYCLFLVLLLFSLKFGCTVHCRICRPCLRSLRALPRRTFAPSHNIIFILKRKTLFSPIFPRNIFIKTHPTKKLMKMGAPFKRRRTGHSSEELMRAQSRFHSNAFLCNHCAKIFRRPHNYWEKIPQIHGAYAVHVEGDWRLGLDFHKSADSGCRICSLYWEPIRNEEGVEDRKKTTAFSMGRDDAALCFRSFDIGVRLRDHSTQSRLLSVKDKRMPVFYTNHIGN
jgi:hypothetical protein